MPSAIQKSKRRQQQLTKDIDFTFLIKQERTFSSPNHTCVYIVVLCFKLEIFPTKVKK